MDNLEQVLPGHGAGGLEPGTDLAKNVHGQFTALHCTALHLNIGMVSSGCSCASWRDRYSWDLGKGQIVFVIFGNSICELAVFQMLQCWK
jgi:hypothetical protein